MLTGMALSGERQVERARCGRPTTGQQLSPVPFHKAYLSPLAISLLLLSFTLISPRRVLAYPCVLTVVLVTRFEEMPSHYTPFACVNPVFVAVPRSMSLLLPGVMRGARYGGSSHLLLVLISYVFFCTPSRLAFVSSPAVNTVQSASKS